MPERTALVWHFPLLATVHVCGRADRRYTVHQRRYTETATGRYQEYALAPLGTTEAVLQWMHGADLVLDTPRS